jgi:hypothetical protein
VIDVRGQDRETCKPKKFVSDQRPERVTFDVVHVVALIYYIGIGQPLGLIGFTSGSYWFGLV